MLYYFYMIYCENFFEEDGCKSIYIGHTEDLNIRLNRHRYEMNSPHRNEYHTLKYKVIRNNGGLDNWNMIKIHSQECENRKEAEKVEDKFILMFDSDLNEKRASLTREEKLQQKKDDYYKKLEEQPDFNKKINEKKLKQNPNLYKDRYEDEKETSLEKITCACGAIICRGGKARHLKRKAHKAWMEKEGLL